MQDWLEQARERLAAAVGDDPDAYPLSAKDTGDILDLARVAARESGERVNAPLLAFLTGIAVGRHPDQDLSTLVDNVVGRDR
jgi:hypothetical protein